MPAGIIAAVRRNSVFDHGVMGVSLTGYSMPIFWWGLLLILLFSVQLGWTPVSGRIDVQVLHRAGHRVSSPSTRCCRARRARSGRRSRISSCPTIVLGTQPLAIIARMTRSAMLEVLGEDYIRTARAKGLSTLRVVALHALRNALIPVITVIGLQVGVLFTGAILTETIFSWPGVGKWMIEAINRRDYPVLQGGVLLLGLVVMTVNLLVDVTYGIINPRIRKAAADARHRSPSPSSRPRRAGRCATSGAISAPITAPWPASSSSSRSRSSRSSRHFIAPYPPDLTNNAVFLKPPAWQAGGAGPIRSAPTPSAATSCRGSSSARACRCSSASPWWRWPSSSASSLGLVAGFFRGVFEIAIMRLMDIILTLPSLLLAIVIVAILGPGIMNAMIAVVVVVLPHYVRITRAAVITETSKDYVTAARASGATRLRLMFSEVLPNCAAPLIVQASLGVSTAILDAAALGFLGLGAQPPASEWGTMLADAREFVLRAWWVVTFPAS